MATSTTVATTITDLSIVHVLASANRNVSDKYIAMRALLPNA